MCRIDHQRLRETRTAIGAGPDLVEHVGQVVDRVDDVVHVRDLEGLDQAEAGRRMGVSRGTVQRMLRSGRSKVLGALLDSSALVIEKGEQDEDLHTHSG